MPLTLKPPRKGKSPNWTIRGTYLNVAVDKSSGTHKRSIARQRLADLERQIERGEYPAQRQAEAGGKQRPTFLSAAVAYMEAGRRRRYVAKLIGYFGETPLDVIDQAAVDAAAVALHPHETIGVAGTRNACVYTPVSAILRHAQYPIKLRRPKGAKGRARVDWLTPDDATAIVRAAAAFDGEFALLLRFLLYTGVRLNEALSLTWDGFYQEESDVWVNRSKGGPAGAIRIRADLCEDLERHRQACGDHQRRIFRFRQGGHLKHQLVRAKLAALGLACPVRRPKGWRAPPHRLEWVVFHSFRHTWATWMRRYGKLDTIGLRATENWADDRSVRRYAHAVAREEWSRVDLLPAIRLDRSA